MELHFESDLILTIRYKTTSIMLDSYLKIRQEVYGSPVTNGCEGLK